MRFDRPVVLPSDVAVIMSSYPYGDVLQCQELEGLPNTTYRVVTERQTVALRAYGRGQSSLEHIQLELAVLGHLEHMGFESHRVLPGRNGETLQRWQGYWVCAFEFIPGVMARTLPLTPELVGDVGRLVAAFESAMASFVPDAIPEGETLVERGAKVLRKLDAALDARGWEMDTRGVISQWERASAPFVRHSAELRSSVIHADITTSNVICCGAKAIGLVDFDDCLYGATVADVAIALMEFAMSDEIVVNRELAVAFLTQYFRNGGAISPLEETLFVNAIEMIYAIWLAYFVEQTPQYKEAETYLQRLKLLEDDAFRADLCTEVAHSIHAARTLS